MYAAKYVDSIVQLGRASLNTPDLCSSGGDFNCKVVPHVCRYACGPSNI